MSLVRVDARINPLTLEKIKSHAKSENKKDSEIIRELIDIGIAYKDAKNKDRKKQLSEFEEENLKLTNRLISAMNKLISNQYDVDKSPYNTIQEVAESIVESGNISLNKFKEKNNFCE